MSCRVFNAACASVYANDAIVNGAGCTVFGDRCIVNGPQCVVVGNDCVVNGDNCVIRGTTAIVRGNGCSMHGKCCTHGYQSDAAPLGLGGAGTSDGVGIVVGEGVRVNNGVQTFSSNGAHVIDLTTGGKLSAVKNIQRFFPNGSVQVTDNGISVSGFGVRQGCIFDNSGAGNGIFNLMPDGTTRRGVRGRGRLDGSIHVNQRSQRSGGALRIPRKRCFPRT
jgi:hypothetical protein